MTVADFDGLTVPQFTDKLKEVKSLEFLSVLEAHEAQNGSRKGVLSAINERQGEFIEEEKDSNKDDTVSDDRQPDEPQSKESPKEEAESATDTPSPDKDGVDNQDLDKDGEFIDQEEIKAEFIELVKEKRLELDRIHQFLQAHHRIDSSPETDIFLSRAWLGKLMAAFGGQNPYSGEEKIQDRTQIPAAADKNGSNHFRAECNQFNLKDTFKAVIELRDSLDKIIEWLDNVDITIYDLDDRSRNAHICRTQAYTHAEQAKFHLGLILRAQKVG